METARLRCVAEVTGAVCLGLVRLKWSAIFEKLLPQAPRIHLLQAHRALLMKNKCLHLHALLVRPDRVIIQCLCGACSTLSKEDGSEE